MTSSVRTFLIFPKLFELHAFLASLSDNSTFCFKVSSVASATQCDILLHLSDDRYMNIRAFAIDESDIVFSFRLGELIQSVRLKTVSDVKTNAGVTVQIPETNLFFLCGTAGGSTRLGHTIGQAVKIDRAVKFDRGDLHSNAGVFNFTPREGKHVEALSSWGAIIGSRNSALCSNSVMHFDPALMEFNVTVTDMETFEYFKTCQLNLVPEFTCLRVISDLTGEGIAMQATTKKNIRKTVKFTQLIELLKTELSRRLPCSFETRPANEFARKETNTLKSEITANILRVFPLSADELTHAERLRGYENVARSVFRPNP
eukprot:gene3464-3694_t